MTLRARITLAALASLTLMVINCAFAEPKPALDSQSLTARANRLMANHAVYADKVYGAWYGKLIGLILGQPTEGWPRQRIEEEARRVGAFPVTYYLPASFKSHVPSFLMGNFNGSPPNDDSDLMLVDLLALRENGVGLTSRDIANAWVKFVGGACTAEGIAVQNFRKDIWPPVSATYDNPYSEWIGAQMRGDIWGMIAPGAPKVAARYAYLDASISHVRNGIYGEQFMSAAVSVAMVEKDPEKVLRTALKTIPTNCVYAAAIRDVIGWHKQNKDWRATWELVDKKWGRFEDGTGSRKFRNDRFNTMKGVYQWADYKWVYADLNGAVCALALLYGEGDFSKTICIATMCGYDNDCNTGTVGAIVGAMIGEKAIPQRWKDPIHNDYRSGLRMKQRDLKISELADETTGFGLQVMREANSKANK